MRRTVTGVIAAAVMFLGIAVAAAEEPKGSTINLDELKKALGLSIYLQGGYTYNFSDHYDTTDLRPFDTKSDSFNLDLAQLVFAKDPTAGAMGFKVKLSYGETAKYIHSAGLVSSAKDDPFDLTEAYLSYLAPIGRGLRIDFGKFVTYHGAEVIEAKDSPNYSRSFLFYYAIPYTHTGLKASYAFSDAVSASVHLVNGWDNSNDNNSAKTVGASVGLTPAEMFSTYVNLMYGPEKTNNSADNRFLFDWVATVKPLKPLSIILNVDYGTEKNGAAAGDATWSGISVIGKYEISGMYAVAVRGEYFDDRDGARTGVSQNLSEITVTPEIKLANGLIIRPEYRHDMSNEQSFNGGTKKSQDTLAVGLMYTW